MLTVVESVGKDKNTVFLFNFWMVKTFEIQNGKENI